jgi:hypothetical protein
LEERAEILKPVLLCAWACLALAALWLTRGRQTDASSALLATVVLVATLAVSRYAFQLRFSSAPMLYLILLALFHLGLVAPWALGVYDISRATWFVPFGITQAMTMVIYAVLAFQLGVAARLAAKKTSAEAATVRDSDTSNAHVLLAGWLLFLGGVAMFLVGLIGLDPAGYYRLTYSETFRLRAESDPRFFGSGITITLIGMSIAAAGASQRSLRGVFAGAGLWLLALVYWGFRGPALIAGLIVFVIGVKKGVRYPRWLPWAAAGALLIALPVIRLAREEPLNQRWLGFSMREFNILDGPAEMGASVRPLVETLGLIGPTNYRHGRTYLEGLRGVIPNLAAHWESPAAGSIDELPPSLWITAMVDPWMYRNYGGIGFSAIAEPYMNFGIAGVLVFFFGLGLALVYLEEFSARNAYALACWALILGPLLWTTRNDFFNFFRPAVWGLLCVGAIRVFAGGYTLIARSGPRKTEVKPRLETSRAQG